MNVVHPHRNPHFDPFLPAVVVPEAVRVFHILKQGFDVAAESGEVLRGAAAGFEFAALIACLAVIAFFQSFTNTYGDADRLRALYQAAMAPEDVVILSIATRPDCLGPDILGLLEELNRIKPVWVELGLQTIHPESARYLRRGYDLPVFDRAVKDLKAIGVTVIVHQILGLPGETPEMMAETARYIGQSGAEGVKLHLLHVLRNTDLAAEWQAGRVQTLELEEYISILELCLRNLPPEAVIHRLTGDGAKRDLLAPLWSGDKKRVLNAIHQAFLRDNLIQGSTL